MSDLLARTGEALYGAQWQSPLARDLGVSDRTMRRWSSAGPPERIFGELLALVRARSTVLGEIAEALEQAAEAA
jgi:hypothetical protein